MIHIDQFKRGDLDYDENNVYLMHYKNIYKGKFKWDEFTSDVTLVPKQDLHELLVKYDYFKQ